VHGWRLFGNHWRTTLFSLFTYLFILMVLRLLMIMTICLCVYVYSKIQTRPVVFTVIVVVVMLKLLRRALTPAALMGWMTETRQGGARLRELLCSFTCSSLYGSCHPLFVGGDLCDTVARPNFDKRGMVKQLDKGIPLHSMVFMPPKIFWRTDFNGVSPLTNNNAKTLFGKDFV